MNEADQLCTRCSDLSGTALTLIRHGASGLEAAGGNCRYVKKF